MDKKNTNFVEVISFFIDVIMTFNWNLEYLAVWILQALNRFITPFHSFTEIQMVQDMIEKQNLCT